MNAKRFVNEIVHVLTGPGGIMAQELAGYMQALQPNKLKMMLFQEVVLGILALKQP